MRNYPWLNSHYEQIVTIYQTGRMNSALLIQSLPGMGSNELVYSVIRFMLCQQPKNSKNCGKCRSCQLMQAGNHPDFNTLESENNKSLLISVDVVRNLCEKIYVYPRLGNVRVVYVKDATLMTESAVNAMLKTLEEPPDKTYLFFSCHEPKLLHTSLISRCGIYRLNAPQEEWSVNWLQKKVAVSKNVALASLRLCNGAPAGAIEMLQENYWTMRALLLSKLEGALNSNNWLCLIKVLNHEQAPMYLRWLIEILLDALKVQHGSNIITNVDAFSLAKKLAEVLTGAVLNAIIHTLHQSRKRLLDISNLNRELLLTDQLLIIEQYLQPGSILPTYHL